MKEIRDERVKRDDESRVTRSRSCSFSLGGWSVVRGYFRMSAQRYLIEPLSGGDEGDHAVTTFNPNVSTPAVCGVTNTSWSTDFEPPTSRSRSRSGVTLLPGGGGSV